MKENSGEKKGRKNGNCSNLVPHSLKDEKRVHLRGREGSGRQPLLTLFVFFGGVSGVDGGHLGWIRGGLQHMQAL